MLLLSLALAAPCATVDGEAYRTTSTVTFEGTEPTGDAPQVAAELACALKQDPKRKLHIGVHTDSRGSSTYNERISGARADALMALVVAAGAEPHQVSARGYGEAYPVAPNSTTEGRNTNQRVELLTADPQRPEAAPRPVPKPVPPTPPPAPDPCKPLPTPDTPCTGVHLCPVDQDTYLECSNGEWTRITEWPADR